jgi:hypothetical protein
MMAEQPEANAPHHSCSICSQLKDREYGLQTHGREEEDTFLPEVGEKLKRVRDLKPENCRYMYLARCPECGTHYLFKSDYEYLATGSEEEQILQRLTEADAARYSASPEYKD